jgi:hypothetical protein
MLRAGQIAKGYQQWNKIDARPRKKTVVVFLSSLTVGLTERRLTNATKNSKEQKEQKFIRKKYPPPKKYLPGDFFGNALNCFPRVFELPLPRSA